MPDQGQEVVVGLDNGGTAVNATVLDSAGRFLVDQLAEIPSRVAEGPAVAIEALTESFTRVLGLTGTAREAVRAVGLDTPGPASAAGVISSRGAVNFVDPAWRGFDVRSALEARLALPVVYNNDANAASLYAHHVHFGPSSARRSSVSLIVGTGLGGGVIESGGVVRGAAGMAGEFGHMRIPLDGLLADGQPTPVCNCGLPGDGESVASLTGIEKNLLPYWLTRYPRHELHAVGSMRQAAALVRGYAGAGDPMALEIFRQQAIGIGRLFTIAANFTDPDAYFLGGGVVETVPSFRDWFLATVREHTDLRDEQFPHVTFALVPDLDMAGARGAAIAAGDVLGWASPSFPGAVPAAPAARPSTYGNGGPMPPEVLSRRALNRALLQRQQLLSRAAPPGGERPGPVLTMVEQLAGLQAQAPFPPYFGLWSRLDGFVPGDLAAMLLGRRVVRIALMRGTIHLVSARDCLAMRPLIQPVLDRGFRTGFARQLGGVDETQLADMGRTLVEEEPRTFSELGTLLAKRWPAHPPAALAQGVRALVPLVQVPPRAVWGQAGQARHTSAESWLGAPLDERAGLDWLVRRYLAAFGPATVQDAQAWSGLTRLREITDRLRPGLRTFRDEHGRELFDLPDAPRPDPDTPAPVRLVAEFDNLTLSHADRSRVISDQDRRRLYSRNGIFPGIVLVAGYAVGMWRISQAAGATTLTVELFGPAADADRDALRQEGERMLAFAAPADGPHAIRFADLT